MLLNPKKGPDLVETEVSWRSWPLFGLKKLGFFLVLHTSTQQIDIDLPTSRLDFILFCTTVLIHCQGLQ